MTIPSASWPPESVAAFAPALYSGAPARLVPVEENTLPSWLWKKRAADSRRNPETSVQHVIDRVVGASTYAGWKLGLWSDESEARAFYDDARYMLTHRMIALEPAVMATLGVDWAYGQTQAPSAPVSVRGSEEKALSSKSFTNLEIDTIVSKSSSLQRLNWQKCLRKNKEAKAITLTFPDTAKDWAPIPDAERLDSGPRLVIDLLKFVNEDGSLALTLLRHTVRISVLLLETLYEQMSPEPHPARPMAVGYVNLSPVLMALGIPYDSAKGRSTAAAITAILTAEAIVTSSETASTLGVCADYRQNHESVLRVLRNHVRAVYGERNDYERISILPACLDINDGADLVLVATARRAWEEAVREVQKNGLRHLRLTGLFSVPAFTPLLECSAQGIEVERNLLKETSLGGEAFGRAAHPALTKALRIAKCDPADIKSIVDYAVGYGTLRCAPAINHSSLREKGFDDVSLERLESYLPRVKHIRQAFTVWILGDAFCRDTLKIASPDLLDPRFELLEALGFKSKDIETANAFCCGSGTVTGALELPQHLSEALDTCNVAPDARIRMAAAVQSMLFGKAEFTVTLPHDATINDREDLLLLAWMQGVKSITLDQENKYELTAHRIKSRRQDLRKKIGASAIERPKIPVPYRSPAIARLDRTSSRASIVKQKPKSSARILGIKKGISKILPIRVK